MAKQITARYTPKTVRNIYNILKPCLEKAVELDMIRKNPCTGTILPKRKKYKADYYDEDEVRALLEAALNTDMYLPVCMEICCGLRRGELLGLRWENVDFENKRINICENLIEVDTQLQLKTPKTESSVRNIDIPDSLVELLRKEYSEQNVRRFRMRDSYSEYDFVICQSNGDPYSSDSMTRKWTRFLDRNNLRHIRFHDLRHTCATLMLSEGINIKVIQERLGHADISTTMNIYAHVVDNAKREASDLMEKVVFQPA